jgi:FkbM family methyltransferase
MRPRTLAAAETEMTPSRNQEHAGLRRLLNALPRQLRRQKLLVAMQRSGLIDAVQLLEFNGNGRAWVDLRDAECRASFLSQSFWPEFHPIVAAFLRGGGDLFDVGAHFGLVTFGVVPIASASGVRFHLFEANAAIIPQLGRSASLWPGESFVVNHCCVTDEPGVSRLTLPDDCWGHAVIDSEGTEAPNLLLDDYIESRGIQRIAFLKMDVNGWEPRALRGAGRSLAAGKIEAAFVEVVRENAEEIQEMMRALGFDAYFCGLWDHPDEYGLDWRWAPVHGTRLQFAAASPLPPTYQQGDVLFLKRGTAIAAAARSAAAGQRPGRSA